MLRRPRTARFVWIAAAAVAVVLTALLIGGPTNSESLDPRSTAPDGTKALALLLRALRANVDIGPVLPAAPDGVALVLRDDLNRSDEAKLHGWVDRGGRLVVTDLASNLAGVAPDESTNDLALSQHAPLVLGEACSVAALQRVGAVSPDGDALLRAQTSEGQTGCYRAGSGFLLVTRHQGDGVVTVMAGPGPWLNANLGHADNSVLAASLLAPLPGTNVTFIGDSPIGGGNKGLLGLISPRAKEAFWGLVAAFVLLVLWKSRRLGRPVGESLPVELPASGLVVATGNLLQESRQRSHAASILRADLRRLIRDRMGVDLSESDQVAAEVAAVRAGLRLEQLEAVLMGPPPADDDELVAMAASAAEIKQEVLHAR